jgi:hypothetical protein
MIEMVVALCMFLGDKLIEHSPKKNLSECLETKRKIERNTDSGNMTVQCGVVKAKVYVDKHGIKRIEKIEK